eukprot:gene2958-3773_t
MWPRKSESPTEESHTLETTRVNGITMRYATCGARDAPLVLLLHGWPESWFSWRHQLRALANAGYHAVAPDMRGYGGTDAPQSHASYTVATLAGDVIGLMHALGYACAFLVGHDWGAWLTWQLALLHPTLFPAIAVLSVPYAGRGRAGLLTLLKQKYGDPEDLAPGVRRRAAYHYQLHNALPQAAEGYDANVRETLYRLYGFLPGCASDPPEETREVMFPDGDDQVVGFWRRLPRPKELPGWLSEADLEYFVREFERTGFHASLNWYRTGNLNWELTPHLETARVQQPTLFLAGGLDMVIRAHGGAARVQEQLATWCAQPPRCVMYAEAGHWIQQERSEEVSAEIVQFLAAQPERAQEAARPAWHPRARL